MFGMGVDLVDGLEGSGRDVLELEAAPLSLTEPRTFHGLPFDS